MINHYKLAPTFLYHPDFEPKLFHTQEEVDDAWDEGWFGPANLVGKGPLISEMEFESKAKTIAAIRMDPRYKGISVNPRMNLQDIHDAMNAWEKEHLTPKQESE